MTDESTHTSDDQAREEKLRSLREEIRKGAFEVDPQKTAEAMIEKAANTQSGSEDSTS